MSCKYQQCTGLKTATLLEGLTGTGIATFWKCSNLESVRLPSTLTKIDMLCFDGCGLNYIIIPEGVTTIDMNAFSSCKSLSAISFPSTLTNIVSYAFGGCTGLKNICCGAEETPEVDETVFNNVAVSGVTLYVPDNSMGAYRAHPVWGKFLMDSATPIVSPIREREEGGNIFNLAGQRLSKMQKGINIVGGRKIIRD